jgi:hypothetical protein
MGDCYSRPRDSQILYHKSKENHENDKVFIRSLIDDIGVSIDTLSLLKLQEIVKSLELEQNEFLKKIGSSTAGIETTPEINIEIQQGVELFIPGCFNHLKPFIRVSLEPKGPTFDTVESDKYLPEWFQMISIKQSLSSFETVRVSVLLDKSANKKAFGYFDFSIPELYDQETREGWFNIKHLKTEHEFKPKLKLRIQLIHDERALHVVLIKKSNEYIDRINALILSKTN